MSHARLYLMRSAALVLLCLFLAAEYRYRFDKVHASEAALAWVIRHRSAAQVPDGPEMFNRDRPFALAMPEKYKVNLDEYTFVGTAAVMAYRTYYRAEKRGHWRTKRAGLGWRALAAVGIGTATDRVWVPAKWTRRNPPEWFG